MGMTEVWVSADAPPDEAYWRALLRDGENGRAAFPGAQVELWEERDVDGAAASAEPVVVDGGWQAARQAMERDEVLELAVTGYNRGGVLVELNGLRGFVPASHLASLPSFADEDERNGELRRLVGTRLQLKVIELEPEQRRFVLSERATQLEEGNRQDVLDSLCPGDVCRGCVTNLCSFGAFVDLGGVEGLVHVSELSWGRVAHPGDVLEPGQPVEVYVLNVDRERGRVGLSIKRLRPDPWQIVEERYQIGQVVEGTVTHVVDFGAFTCVEGELEGLIHVSEMAEGDFGHPRNVLQEGDTVKVRILNIDGERRRMGLSMRQVNEPFPVEG